jgi:dynein light chain Tctex-type 1
MADEGDNIGEDVQFTGIKELVAASVNESVEKHLKGKAYSATDAPGWTNLISDEIVKQLQGVNRNFKYSVICTIMQKSDAGLHMSSSCFWNTATDGNSTIRWDNDSMYCIVNVFGFAL